jgi:biopolymer transport protein ExbD
MDFREHSQRKPREENVIPMINVVFLLLIFFLMTAQIAPPDPFEVTPPTASSEAPDDSALTLYINAKGDIAFRDTIGEAAAIDALELAYIDLCADIICTGSDARPPLTIRADGGADALLIPTLLKTLAAREITNVFLTTRVETAQP